MQLLQHLNALALCVLSFSLTTGFLQQPAVQDSVKQGPVLTGRVVDENQKPIQGATIVLWAGAATRFRGQEATTDRDGTYCFDPITTGGLMSGDDGETWALFVGIEVLHATHVAADGASWRDLAVPHIDRHVETKDFQMTPGGRLSGSVVDARNAAPFAGLDLLIKSTLTPSKFSAYAKTDEKGRFSVDVLFPGEYVVEVNAPRNLKNPALGKVVIQPGKSVDANFDYP